MRNDKIFTPKHIVDEMLDLICYNNADILKKHIIDNSCGNGAFLKEIVRRYIFMSKISLMNNKEIKYGLEKYIHGIEIDESLCLETIKQLNDISNSEGIYNVKFDVKCSNALSITEYNNKMDYVIGNPPYVRTRYLTIDKELMKLFKLSNFGMVDLYISFFELGLNMLNDSGELCYITPNSWLKCKNAKLLRKYIHENKLLSYVKDFGHKKVFNNANVYPCIALLSKKINNNNILFKSFQNNIEKTLSLKLDDIIFNEMFVFSEKENLSLLKDIEHFLHKDNIKYKFSVKNGICTCSNEFFIIDDFIENNHFLKNDKHVLITNKISCDKKHYLFYPYDENGYIVPFETINDNLKKYLLEKAEKLNIDTRDNTWYHYGKTQALKDVYKEKIAINNLYKDIYDIRIKICHKKEGVIHSLYILPPKDKVVKVSEIENIFKTDTFINFAHCVGNIKNGGYSMVSGKYIEMYLNYIFNKN